MSVYSEFFTELAVAWFAIGVAAPLLSFEKLTERTPLMVVGFFGTFVLLQVAVIISVEGKKHGKN